MQNLSSHLQVHRHSHAIAVDQQRRRQALPQHLQVTQVRRTVLLAMRRTVHRGWQGCKYHRRLTAMLDHQLIQDQMLCPAGKIIE